MLSIVKPMIASTVCEFWYAMDFVLYTQFLFILKKPGFQNRIYKDFKRWDKNGNK